MNNNYVLYMHTTPSGKRYFGITCQSPKRRWRYGRGYEKQQRFWNAIKKYGWSNMGHYILADNLTKEEVMFFEKVMIALYDTTNCNNGYNETTGGEHYKHTEEYKRRRSESMMRENGYIHPIAKPVMCKTTGLCFYSTTEAGRHYGINDRNISTCCRGERQSAGKLNGEKLVWCFISDLPRPQLTEADKEHLRHILNKYSA